MGFNKMPLDGAGIPMASAVVPGNATPLALQGSLLTTTDSNTNTTSGIVSADQVQQMILGGQAYIATTTLFATATNPSLTMGMALINPANSGKNVYVFSLRWHPPAATMSIKYHLLTTNPSYANAIAPQNLKQGGASGVVTVTSAANGATASISTAGTLQDIFAAPQAGTIDFFSISQ